MNRTGALRSALLAVLLLSPASGHGEQAATSYSGSVPDPLLCYPLPARGDGHSEIPGGRNMARVLVGTDGFVHRVGFEGTPPTDSTALAAAFRRWIFRPAEAQYPDGTMRSLEVWIRIPYSAAGGALCAHARTAARATRPDSLLRSRLLSASAATALRLQPPTSANFDSLRLRLDIVDSFAGSLVADTRTVDPKEHATSLLAAIDLALERGATEVLATGCLPEPDFALRFAGTNRTNGTDVFVSLRCDFVQIRSPEATLLVSVQRVRERLLALEAALFRPAPR